MCLLDFDVMTHVFFQLDKASLSSCSVVSQQWHAASTGPLFHTIIILNAADKHNMVAFQEYCDSDASLRTRRYIKALVLRGDQPRPGDRHDYLVVTADDIATVLNKLPQLHTLQFKFVRTDWLRDYVTERDNPRSLKLLSFERVEFDVPDEGDDRNHMLSPEGPPCSFVQLLNLFSTIEDLRVIMVEAVIPTVIHMTGEWGEFSQQEGRKISPHVRVRAFRFQKGLMGIPVVPQALLCAPHGCDELQCLELYDHNSGTHTFLEYGGKVLRHLTFCVDDVQDSGVAVSRMYPRESVLIS